MLSVSKFIMGDNIGHRQQRTYFLNKMCKDLFFFTVCNECFSATHGEVPAIVCSNYLRLIVRIKGFVT